MRIGRGWRGPEVGGVGRDNGRKTVRITGEGARRDPPAQNFDGESAAQPGAGGLSGRGGSPSALWLWRRSLPSPLSGALRAGTQRPSTARWVAGVPDGADPSHPARGCSITNWDRRIPCPSERRFVPSRCNLVDLGCQTLLGSEDSRYFGQVPICSVTPDEPDRRLGPVEDGLGRIRSRTPGRLRTNSSAISPRERSCP